MHFLGADKTRFPSVDSADDEGILAVGGDLSPERLINAYKRGIFPWYSDGLPILWHCPDPRFVLVPDEMHVPKSLKKSVRRREIVVTFDTDFEAVIDGCARTSRPGQKGTWITRDMRKAYLELHRLGYAHSAEARIGKDLVGGLYGVGIGHVFFGESMFSLVDDGSKVAFVLLVEWLKTQGVKLIDCQQQTAHLARFGAIPWPRKTFVHAVETLSAAEVTPGPWKMPVGFAPYG